MGKTKTPGIFESALANMADATNNFVLDLGGLDQDILESQDSAGPYIQRLREEMLKHSLEPSPESIQELAEDPIGFFPLEKWAKSFEAEYRKVKGEIMAIDATPLMNPVRGLANQVFGCAVGGMSYGNISISSKITKTTAKLADLEEGDSIQKILEKLREVESGANNQSWPTTFMEYCERRYALNSESSHILFDGALITQNLLTQASGRELLTSLLSKEDRFYLAVIKSLQRSTELQRWYSRALEPGEAFVIGPVFDLYVDRFDSWGFKEDGPVWHQVKTLSKDVVRGLFRPGNLSGKSKVFGFECKVQDLPLALAILWFERDRQIGHEIPFLLNQVDAKIRGLYRPNEINQFVQGRYSSVFMEDAIDELDERDFR